MLIHKKVAITIIAISMVFIGGCSSDNKQDNFYVYTEINKEEHLCFLKKPLDDEKYEGELKQYGRDEKIINCDIILPKKFKDKYQMCVLSGVTVDGSDHDGQNNLKGWSCDMGRVTSKVTMYLKSTAKRGVVSCSMLCVKN